MRIPKMQKSAQNSEKDKLACFLKRYSSYQSDTVNWEFSHERKIYQWEFFLTSQRMADEHNSLVHILLLIL